MGKVTRGTLLATLKELKKHKRPKPATTAVAVQAICPKQVVSVDKTAELKVSIERRRTLSGGNTNCGYETSELYKKFEQEFDAYMVEQRSIRELRKKAAIGEVSNTNP